MSKLLEGKSFKSAIKIGALAGFFAGPMAEVTAESLPQDWSPETRGNIAKLVTTASSAFTGFDPEITKSVAVNAIEHNFLPHAIAAASPLVIGTGKVAWEVYSLTHEEELQEYRDKAVDQISDLTGISHEKVEIIVDAGMTMGSTARAIKQGVKKVGTSLAINKAKSEIKNLTITKPKVAPKKFDLNNNNHTNPAPNPAPKPVEKKTPNFMKPTGSSSARAVEKKPVNQMTNQEFVQEIANRAERKIGGSGAVSGTKKHSYAKKLGERSQKMLGERELKFEQSYVNNMERLPKDPLKGSTRLDVYDKKNEVVYDYKFVQNPGKGLKQKQIDKIKQQGPEVKDVIEINPKKE